MQFGRKKEPFHIVFKVTLLRMLQDDVYYIEQIKSVMYTSRFDHILCHGIYLYVVEIK